MLIHPTSFNGFIILLTNLRKRLQLNSENQSKKPQVSILKVTRTSNTSNLWLINLRPKNISTTYFQPPPNAL